MKENNGWFSCKEECLGILKRSRNKSPILNAYLAHSNSIILEGGLLRPEELNGTADRKQLIISHEPVRKILEENHDGILGGQLGVTITAQKARTLLLGQMQWKCTELIQCALYADSKKPFDKITIDIIGLFTEL